MKLLVIGVGDCGCRLAGEFGHLNRLAKIKRRVSIVTHTYAVNTDQAFLAALARGKPDGLQAVFVRSPSGGDYKSAEAGAELVYREMDRISGAIQWGGFVETDAVLLIAGAAGSLGAGGLPVIARQLKERYAGKPVYALIILPFNFETDKPQCILNTAICLKSIDKTADAVILADNGDLGSGEGKATDDSMANLNRNIALPFYDLLCAGETAGQARMGIKVLDTGDVVQTLSGWTAIGVGTARFSSSAHLWKRGHDFQTKGSETLTALEAMNSALARLSVDCRLEDAGKALSLLSTSSKEASIDMAKSLGNRLHELAPNADIRGGNFYGAKGFAQVTVAVSALIYVGAIRNFYARAGELTRAETDRSRGQRDSI